MTQEKFKVIGKEHVKHSSGSKCEGGKTSRKDSQRRVKKSGASKERSPGVKTSRGIVGNDEYSSKASYFVKDKILRLPKKVSTIKGIHFRTTSHKEFNLHGFKTLKERMEEKTPVIELSEVCRSSRSKDRKYSKF